MDIKIKLPRRPKAPVTSSPPAFGESVSLSISTRGESADWIAMNVRPLNRDGTLYASTLLVAMHLNRGAAWASNGLTAVDSVRFSGAATQLLRAHIGGVYLNYLFALNPGGSAWVLTKKTGAHTYSFSFWPMIAGKGDAVSVSWV